MSGAQKNTVFGPVRTDTRIVKSTGLEVEERKISQIEPADNASARHWAGNEALEASATGATPGKKDESYQQDGS